MFPRSWPGGQFILQIKFKLSKYKLCLRLKKTFNLKTHVLTISLGLKIWLMTQKSPYDVKIDSKIHLSSKIALRLNNWLIIWKLDYNSKIPLQLENPLRFLWWGGGGGGDFWRKKKSTHPVPPSDKKYLPNLSLMKKSNVGNQSEKANTKLQIEFKRHLVLLHNTNLLLIF